MKYLAFAMMAFTLLCTVSCSEDDNVEEVDPIVGTWENVAVANEVNSVTSWIFDADETGDYSFVQEGETIDESEFSWTVTEGVYTIDYASEEMEDIEIVISEFMGVTTIETTDEWAKVLATRK